MKVSMTINGKAVELTKAYSSIRRHERCFLGWYVDVRALKAEQKYDIKLDLPELMPGQFQGLFVENIETRRTGAIK